MLYAHFNALCVMDELKRWNFHNAEIQIRAGMQVSVGKYWVVVDLFLTDKTRTHKGGTYTVGSVRP